MKKILIGIVVSAAVISALIMFEGRPVKAEDAAGGAVLAKLDEVMNNQKAILDELASIKEELGIVKIRVTQMQ